MDDVTEGMDVPPPPPPVPRGSPDPLAMEARLRGFARATTEMVMDNVEQSFARFHCHGPGGCQPSYAQ